MARFRILKNSLLGGQISRDAVGRTDLPQYAHSCEILQNMIPLLSGGAYRRPGTMFQDCLPADSTTPNQAGLMQITASSPPRIFPFIVSNQQSFAIVVGVNRFDFDALSHSGGAYMSYYRATGNTNQAYTGGVVYNCLPYRCKALSVAASGTYESTYTRQGGPGAVANSGTNGGATAVLDIADSLQNWDDDVWSVQFCQANDVMFLTHPDYQPQVVYLNGSGIPQAAPYDYPLSGLSLAQTRPYLNQNSTATQLAYVGTVTVGSVGALNSSAALFNPLHAPRTGIISSISPTDGAIFAIAVAEGANVATGSGMLFCQVQAYTSATSVTVKLLTAPGSYASGTALTAWWESAWSNYRGWPRACAIFQQRLCMAGTAHQPNALWFTATGAYGAPNSNINTYSKFTALGDGPGQGIVAGAAGALANGRNYTTPHDWVYYPVDDSQGDGQSTGPLGSQPFRVSLATTSLDAIQYLSPDQQLFIGTATQEWLCAVANNSFDVANSECTVQSHYGSDLIQAVRIGYELMFVLQNKCELRAYQYNYFDQSFFGEPVQLFFDELPQGEQNEVLPAGHNSGRRKFRSIDWDASRSTLWCVDTAGNFFGLTRDRKLAITTWHTHQLGGYDSTHGAGHGLSTGIAVNNYYSDSGYYQVDGTVVSACTTPNPLSGIRDIWMVVKRSYQGGNSVIWNVERIVGANTVRESAYSFVAPGNAQEPLLVDCAYFLTDTGPVNLGYQVGAFLSGQTLQGTYYSQAWGIFALTTQAAVDASGNFALQSNLPPDYGTGAAHTMVVGLNYNSVVMPVRPDMPSAIGSSQGAMKRPSKAYMRVFKSLMCKIGRPPNTTSGFFTAAANLEVVRFSPASQTAQSPEIYTGDKEVFLPNGFDRDGYVYILQDQPLPFTLVSISLEGTEYEQ